MTITKRVTFIAKEGSEDKMKELFYAVERDYAFERNKKKRYERIMALP